MPFSMDTDRVIPAWEWSEVEMPTTIVEETHNPHTAEAYEVWLERGQLLALEHNNRNWLLGDWVNEGDDAYNVQSLGIPSYMLIGSHPPNFWKQTSDAVDLAIGTLKNLALVGRRFPPDKRIPGLSWSHHALAAPYERRFEYVLACVDDKGQKIHTVEWLAHYIEKQEGEPEEVERKTIPLRLPVGVIKKLKEVAKHYGKSLDEIAYDACATAIHHYLQQQAIEISMQIYGYHDEGIWPFQPGAIAHYDQAKRKVRAQQAAWRRRK